MFLLRKCLFWYIFRIIGLYKPVHDHRFIDNPVYSVAYFSYFSWTKTPSLCIHGLSDDCYSYSDNVQLLHSFLDFHPQSPLSLSKSTNIQISMSELQKQRFKKGNGLWTDGHFSFTWEIMPVQTNMSENAYHTIIYIRCACTWPYKHFTLQLVA